jgi:hypothetical protein
MSKTPIIIGVVVLLIVIGLVMYFMMSGDEEPKVEPEAEPKVEPKVEPEEDPTPAPKAAAPPVPTNKAPPPAAKIVDGLPVSTNGRCGASHGNTRCGGKACCSAWNWCGGQQGTKSDHCTMTTKGAWNGKYDGRG